MADQDLSEDVPLARSPTLIGTLDEPNKKLKSNVFEGGQKQPKGNDDTQDKEAGLRGEEHPQKDPFLVTFEDHAPINPQNWSRSFRWVITVIGGGFVFNSAFASVLPSQLLPAIGDHYGIGIEVALLTISLFVAGYCVGPIFWGPLSERYGRQIIFTGTIVPYLGCQIGCALSPNIGGLLVFRFLSGCFAAAPQTIVGGVLADIWNAEDRANPLCIFAWMVSAGPAFGPIISGALAVTGTDWRWAFWILTILTVPFLLATIFIVPETFPPVLLHKEAQRIRNTTGNNCYYTEWEKKIEAVTLRQILDQTILKPFIMIVEEPMLLLLTTYLSFVYGLIYLLFEALPIVFQETHGLNPLLGGLPFLAIPLGGFISVLICILIIKKHWLRTSISMKPKRAPPELRLIPVMIAAPLLVVAFFMFGWTSYKSVSIAAPIVSIVIFGVCVNLLFTGIFAYLIDTYLMNAASALAINTIARSAFGAGFPLFATQMYDKLGSPGASSLLGGLAIVFMPAPFLLYKYGKRVRQMSKNAIVLD